jgi:hypothetical protein
VEASLYRGVSVALKKGAYRDRWRAAGVCVPTAAGALVPGLRYHASSPNWDAPIMPERCTSGIYWREPSRTAKTLCHSYTTMSPLAVTDRSRSHGTHEAPG